VCGIGDVEGIEHRVLPGGSGWPGRSAFCESASYMEPGANEEAAMTMAPFQGLLKISWILKNAVGFEAASAPRPARPSRQAPS